VTDLLGAPNRRGQNRHRRMSSEALEYLHAQARGRCQRCGEELGPDWHKAHLTAWSSGGALALDEMHAQCGRCMVTEGSRNAIARAGIKLREWQSLALEQTLRRLFDTGVFTTHAAPGAGKTLYAGIVYASLRAAGLCSRLVIVVPNSNLKSQWQEALNNALGVNLDDSPRDGWLEHTMCDGAVVTYQSLMQTVRGHQTRIEQDATLVVLDEVHHVGEPQRTAWGRAVRQIVGDVAEGEVHPAAVLNVTGTLFRLSKRNRISTVRYEPVPGDDTKLQAIPDFSISTADLIGVHLRPPVVFTYDSEVRLLDTVTEEIIDGDIADLARPQQSAALKGLFQDQQSRCAYVHEAWRLLQVQQRAIGHDVPLKLLYVAHNQRYARLAADDLNDIVGDDIARLVISDEPDAERTLRQAAREKRQIAIVTVRMVTEGFDCPELAMIAYASNVTAELSIAQVMARAMRITQRERSVGKILPAYFLIPNHPLLRSAFNRALAGQMHVLDAIQNDDESGGNGSGPGPTAPRYELLDLTEWALHSAMVLGHEDGEVLPHELDAVREQMAALHVPEVYAPQVVVLTRRIPRFPRLYSANDAEAHEPATEHKVTRRPANPRELNIKHRERLKRMASWMATHVEHDERFRDIAEFQYKGNQAADIESGKRDMATPDQLARVAAWMVMQLQTHCKAYHDGVAPSWLGADD
jgi:superfamily II DNA or RNA helicase